MEKLQRIGKPTIDVLELLLDADGLYWGLQLIKDSGYPSGTIYPMLERLNHAGWVFSVWETESERPGPRRRLYKLTPEGHAEALKIVERRAEAAKAKAKATPKLRPQTA